MEPTSADRRAAAFFAQVSRDLMRDQQEEPTFQTIADRAVQVVPACDSCGISLRQRRHRVETVASSSDLARRADALQYTLDEGPCLQAIWDDDAYLAADVRVDRRWPRWGPRVADEGAGSVLAIRLATAEETLGALNLYSARANAFTEDDVDIALIYAAHATNAMNSARLVTGLKTALQSRHLIGVAQGILMHRYDVTMDHAFEVLRRYSSNANLKLRDLALMVIEQRALPGLGDLAANGRSGTGPAQRIGRPPVTATREPDM